jgi:hypothetical protein
MMGAALLTLLGRREARVPADGPINGVIFRAPETARRKPRFAGPAAIASTAMSFSSRDMGGSA